MAGWPITTYAVGAGRSVVTSIIVGLGAARIGREGDRGQRQNSHYLAAIGLRARTRQPSTGDHGRRHPSPAQADAAASKYLGPILTTRKLNAIELGLAIEWAKALVQLADPKANPAGFRMPPTAPPALTVRVPVAGMLPATSKARPPALTVVPPE